MNRRETIKNLVASSAVLVALPAWAKSWSSSDLGAFPSLLQDRQVILASVVDTIIPNGNGIGALSVGVDKFVARLLENCYEPAISANVNKQLEALDNLALSSHSKSFHLCEQTQREAILLKFSKSDNKEEKDFFNLMKSETIRGFNTSKEVMTQYLNYKIAPGHYYGCVDVKAS